MMHEGSGGDLLSLQSNMRDAWCAASLLAQKMHGGSARLSFQSSTCDHSDSGEASVVTTSETHGGSASDASSFQSGTFGEKDEASILAQCFDAQDTRSVQERLERKDKATIAALHAELPGRVGKLMANNNANHVLQAIFKNLPPGNELCLLVVQELQGQAADVAMHRYGCRVLCRMLEHRGTSQQGLLLADEALRRGESLLTSQYGSPVAECVLEFGSPPQQQRILDMLKSRVTLARDKYGSHVMERALEHANEASRAELVESLMQQEGLWTRSKYGRHVAKRLEKAHGQSVSTRGGFRKGLRK
jgi:hypothetical protein